MCGRFSILNDTESLEKHFQLLDAGYYNRSYNVTPSSDIAVIRTHESQRELITCHWGLIPAWTKDTKLKPINARSETLSSKPFFRSALKNKRCLIPASGFYEWQGSKGQKQPFYFKLKNTDLFAFAGLWEHWQSPDKTIDSCTIITTTANEVMKPVHHRMPVILYPDDYDEWLNEGSIELLKPYTGAMQCYPVSPLVNNPANNNEQLIRPFEN